MLCTGAVPRLHTNTGEVKHLLLRLYHLKIKNWHHPWVCLFSMFRRRNNFATISKLHELHIQRPRIWDINARNLTVSIGSSCFLVSPVNLEKKTHIVQGYRM